VTGNQVKEHVDASVMGFAKESVEILIGAVAGCYLLVIPYVIACILERRVIAGIDPDRIAAKALNIIELLYDTVDISDTVVIGVLEGLWIDFVENSVF
jgi:hypothetical protein